MGNENEPTSSVGNSNQQTSSVNMPNAQTNDWNDQDTAAANALLTIANQATASGSPAAPSSSTTPTAATTNTAPNNQQPVPVSRGPSTQAIFISNIVLLLSVFADIDSSFSPLQGNVYYADSVWQQASMASGQSVEICKRGFGVVMGAYQCICNLARLTEQGLVVGVTFDVRTRRVSMDLEERWEAMRTHENPRVRALVGLKMFTSTPFPWWEQCRKIRGRWESWMKRIRAGYKTLKRADVVKRPMGEGKEGGEGGGADDDVEIGDPGEWKKAAERVKLGGTEVGTKLGEEWGKESKEKEKGKEKMNEDDETGDDAGVGVPTGAGKTV